MGTAPLAMPQLRAPWAGIRPRSSPMADSSATMPSTSSMGWFEKFRLPGGGWAAEYLPVSRPCPMGE